MMELSKHSNMWNLLKSIRTLPEVRNIPSKRTKPTQLKIKLALLHNLHANELHSIFEGTNLINAHRQDTNINTHLHIYIHTNIHTQHIYTCIQYTYISTNMHAYKYTEKHTYIHTTYIQRHIYIDTIHRHTKIHLDTQLKCYYYMMRKNIPVQG